MNKNIVKVFEKYNFVYDKNNGYGEINGYEVNVVNLPLSVGPIMAISTFLTPEEKNVVITKIGNAKMPLVRAEAWECGIKVILGAMTGGSFVKKAPEQIQKIFAILDEVGAKKKNICPVSGEEIAFDNSKKVIINDIASFSVTISNTAVEKINADIDSFNAAYQNASNNYLKGFFGILIGAIAGGIVSIILCFLGFVSAISAVVAVALGISLYKKFGGKPNAVMIVMSLIVTIVVLLGVNYGIYAYGASIVVSAQGKTMSSIEAFKYCCDTVKGFGSDFAKDSGLVAFFAIVGEVSMISYIRKSVARPKKIQ